MIHTVLSVCYGAACALRHGVLLCDSRHADATRRDATYIAAQHATPRSVQRGVPCLEMKSNPDYNPSGQGGLHRAKSNVGLGDVELTETTVDAEPPR